MIGLPPSGGSQPLTREQLVRVLRSTEEKLARGKAMVEAREAGYRAMNRADKKSRAGQQARAAIEALRGQVESIEAVVMGVRFELDEGPEPVDCPHTAPGPAGDRLRCRRGYGHPGVHEHVGTIRRRWE